MLLGSYSSELKAYVHIRTCIRIFIAALYITSKTWKQPRYSSIDDWINKLWYIHAMEYYSVIKRNELSSYKTTRGNLKHILLRERSQSEKVTYYMISTV